MPKVKFLRDALYSIDMKPVTYKAGEVYELPQDQCDRWIKREAAVAHVPQQKAAASEASKPTGGGSIPPKAADAP